MSKKPAFKDSEMPSTQKPTGKGIPKAAFAGKPNAGKTPVKGAVKPKPAGKK